MTRAVFFASLFLFLTVHGEAARCKSYRFRVTRGVSKNAAGLQAVVNGFNGDLGGEDNVNAAGPLKQGRRSINWDAAIVPFDMPADFFKNNVTRGALMISKNNEFRVSNPVPPNGDDLFNSINRVAARDFITFSPKRLFTPLNDNTMIIDFSVPGRKQDAVVRGFGAVYVDVDRRRVTSATYLDRRGCLLTRQFVNPSNRGLSFLGVIFRRPVIARVVLRLGTAPISRRPRRDDVVVLDDFLYSEPQPAGRRRRLRLRPRRGGRSRGRGRNV